MLFWIFYILFCVVIGGIAKHSGRNTGKWFFISLLTSPVIGGMLLTIFWLFKGTLTPEQPKIVTSGMFSNYMAAYVYVTKYYTIDNDHKASAAADLFKYATCRDDCDKLIAKYIN